MLYLDASALVKLLRAEPESAALRAELARWSEHATSVVGEIETRRVGARLAVPPEHTGEIFDRVAVLGLDDAVRGLAAQVGTPTLRSLDAIHLATALSLGDAVGAFCAYDRRLAADAEAAGLTVVAPA